MARNLRLLLCDLSHASGMEIPKGGRVELQEILKKLCLMHDPAAPVVTVALDVAKAKPPHSDPTGFHRHRLLDLLGSGEQPPEARKILREISGRISLFLDSELRPETEGLFLVAGPGIWQPFELGVPIQDFIHVGR